MNGDEVTESCLSTLLTARILKILAPGIRTLTNYRVTQVNYYSEDHTSTVLTAKY
jgi:hypothetical protein